MADMVKVPKSEQMVLVSSVGAVSGVAARGVGLTSGNALVDAAIGVGIFAAGWVLDTDGLGDFVEAFGAGYFLAAVL